MTRFNSESGQAATETVLLTWILILFFAATYQLFLVNEALFRSLTAAHQAMFLAAFEHNCSDSRQVACRYSLDESAQIMWRVEDLPEVRVPVVGIFARYGLPENLQITTAVGYPGSECPDCKRTRMAAGTAWYSPELATGLFNPETWTRYFENLLRSVLWFL